MPRTGTSLRLRKTLRASTSTTFNAPGNYLPPYGSTVIRVGGRGASGNPNIPGNFVPGNFVPGNFVPGNISGHNSGHPGSIAGHNPATVDNHNYGIWTGHAAAYITIPGGQPPGVNNSPFSMHHTYIYPGGPWPGFLAHSLPGPPGTGPFYIGDPAPPYGYSQHAIAYNVNFPANFNGNPNFIPGNPYYNPYVPGNPNFNPNSTNPSTTNPTTPGNPGTAATILGVSFPGGPIGR